MAIKEKCVLGALAILFVAAIILPGVKTYTYKKDSPYVIKSKKPAVMVLSLEGVISAQGGDFLKGSLLSAFRGSLKAVEKDDAVKAVVLRINSPGGHVGSSQELYQLVKAFQEKTKKPVIASIIDYGASGAYWVALACPKVIANPGSMVGSMGVITQSFDFTQIKEKYGLSMRTYKAGAMKDILNPWRPVETEEKAVLTTMLDDIHRQFIETLMHNRKLPRKVAQTLADGRIYTGAQALSLGLIDQLGGFQEAIDLAASLGGITGEPRIKYQQNMQFKQVLDMLKGTETGVESILKTTHNFIVQ